jgi:hypothetical protein
MMRLDPKMSVAGLVTLTIALGFAIVLGLRSSSVLGSGNALMYYQAYATNSPEVGGVLKVLYRFKRMKLCYTDLVQFIIHGENVMWRDGVVGGAAPLGTHSVTNDVVLPSTLEPGDYTTLFRSVAMSTG